MKTPDIYISLKVKDNKIIGAWRFIHATCTYGSMYTDKSIEYIIEDCKKHAINWKIDLGDVVWCHPFIEDLYAKETHCRNCQKDLYLQEKWEGGWYRQECNKCGNSKLTIRPINI